MSFRREHDAKSSVFVEVERALRNRLIAAHTATILVIVLMVVATLVAFRYVTGKSNGPTDLADDLVLAHRLTVEAEHFVTVSRRYILKKDPSDRTRITEIEIEIAKLRRQFIARRRLMQAEPEVAEVENALDDYVAAISRGVAEDDDLRLRSSGDDLDALRDQLVELEAQLATRRRSLAKAIDEFVKNQREVLDVSLQRSDELARRVERTLDLIAMGAILLSVILGIVALRGATRQAREARATAQLATRITDSRKQLVAAAHDLRSPLRGILTHVKALETMKQRDDAEREELETISTAAKEVAQLLERLFALSRVQLGTVSLRSVVAEPLVDAATDVPRCDS